MSIALGLSRRALPLVLLLGYSACCGAAKPALAEVEDPARLFPDTAVAYLEVTQPGLLLDHALNPRLMDLLRRNDQVARFLASNDFRELQEVAGHLEGRLQARWQDVLREVAGSVHLAANPGTQAVILIVRSRNAERLARLHEEIVALSEADAARRGREPPLKWEQAGETRLWNAGTNSYHAVVGELLIVSNRREGVQAALDRRAGKLRSLVDLPEYQQARAQVEPGQAAWALLRLSALRLLPNVNEALARRADNPLTELLLGGILDTVKHAPLVSASLHASSHGATLRLHLPRQPEKLAAARAWHFPPPGEPAGLAPLRPAGAIATLAAYRDLAGMWQARDELFDEGTRAGLAQADSNLGLFFSGRDFGTEVLGQLSPRFQLVAARQTFSPDQPQPAVKLPALALVLELKQPDEFADELLAAYQSLLGLLNLQAAQEGRPKLLLASEEYRGVSISKATYLAAADTDKTAAPNYFNASPACARVGSRFVLSSTLELAKSLVDSLLDPAAAAPDSSSAADNVFLEINVPQGAAVLEDNRSSLVSQNMLSEGHSREQAEQQVGLLLDVLRLLGTARLRLAADAELLKLEASLGGR